MPKCDIKGVKCKKYGSPAGPGSQVPSGGAMVSGSGGGASTGTALKKGGKLKSKRKGGK